MARKSNRRRRPAGNRQYQRSERLGPLFQEIIADYFLSVNEEFDFFTITGVKVDSELSRARVFISSLDDDEQYDSLIEKLDSHKIRIQKTIGAQARIRRMPELFFEPDPAIIAGSRVEDILKEMKNEKSSNNE